MTGLLGQVFGAGGGDKVARAPAQRAAAAARCAGGQRGLARPALLAGSGDPVTTSRRFPYTTERRGRTPGSLVIDPGSLDERARRRRGWPRRRTRVPPTRCWWAGTAPPPATRWRSWARSWASTTPSCSWRSTLTGAASTPAAGPFPGLPYVLIGRARDYAWSATSAGTDNTDQFLEQLCNPDGGAPTRASTHYRYKGRCRPMKTFNAGLLGAGDGEPERQLVYHRDGPGPVSGTVRSAAGPTRWPACGLRAGGRRSNGFIGSALNEAQSAPARTSPGWRTSSGSPSTCSTSTTGTSRSSPPGVCRSARRAPTRASRRWEPAATTGAAFSPARTTPRRSTRKSGLILNWNNKPAAGFGAADSNWSYQSVHRNHAVQGLQRRNRLHDVLSVVNRAATQDVRAVAVWPVINDVLKGGAAPDQRSRQAADLVSAWVRRGASRLDRDLDGKVDDPGAAVFDQSWDALSEAVLRPVLGDLAAPGGLSGQLIGRDTVPGAGTVAPSAAAGTATSRRTCARCWAPGPRGLQPALLRHGDLGACRQSLWAVITRSADALAAVQGPDPAAWRSDATEERIEFRPGVLGPRYTMRWANRPTLHQLMEFSGHRRPRSRPPAVTGG